MDQPTSRIRSPWRTWLDPLQNNLVLGVSFWLGLALVALLLLYSGYNALVGANKTSVTRRWAVRPASPRQRWEP